MRGRHVVTSTSVAGMLLALWVAHAARAQASSYEPAPEPVLELSLAESLIAPGRIAVALSDSSLAAGTASGAEAHVRLLAWPGWVIGMYIMAVQRSSRDPGLRSSRFWQFGAEFARRFRLTEAPPRSAGAVPLIERIEFRLGLRSGYDLLKFTDADALTTGLGIAAIGSAHFRIEQGIWLELAVGLLAQPFGGNGLSDVTLPPTAAGSVGFCAQFPFQ